MADDIGLDSFLDDIASRDEYLKSAPAMTAGVLPPVRGADPVEEVPPPRKPKKAAAAAAEQAAPPPVPKDEAAIWDDDEVSPSVPARPSTAPAAVAGETAAKGSSGGSVKPRQRKHAYEYFNQWDAYDVDGELDKLEEKKKATGGFENETDAPKEKNDGLPPDLTAAMLSQMPAVEIERRALNEKNKGNEAYKASEYKTASLHYTHSLRLQQNNAIVYANRGMCYLKPASIGRRWPTARRRSRSTTAIRRRTSGAASPTVGSIRPPRRSMIWILCCIVSRITRRPRSIIDARSSSRRRPCARRGSARSSAPRRGRSQGARRPARSRLL